MDDGHGPPDSRPALEVAPASRPRFTGYRALAADSLGLEGRRRRRRAAVISDCLLYFNRPL